MTDDTTPSPGMDAPQPARRKEKMPADWDEALDGEWDDEMASDAALAEGADVELIVNYLNRRLDPAQLEEVRRRLEDDPAFRDLAAPLILTWSIPKHLERHPRPPGELERDWDEFTRRVGFTHQRRKARRRRLGILGLVLLVTAAAAFAGRDAIRDWYVARRDFAAVPRDTGWIHLGDSIFVRRGPDASPRASLRASRALVRGDRHVLLVGAAAFRVLPLDSASQVDRTSGVVIRTRGGVVSSSEGQFTVTTRGDTTEVAVQRPSRRRFMYIVPMPTGARVRRDPLADPLRLRELDRALLVRDRPPELLPRTDGRARTLP